MRLSENVKNNSEVKDRKNFFQVSGEKSLPKTIFPFLWYFLREHKGVVFTYTFLALAAGLWGPLNSLAIRELINLLPSAEGGNIELLILPASLIVLNFIVFDNFTWRGIGYVKYRFMPLLLNKVDNALLNQTLQHSHQFFQERMSGTLAKQIFHLIDGFEKIVGTSAANILRATSLLTAAFVASSFVNPIFTLVLGVWFLFFSLISLKMSKKLIVLSEVSAVTGSILGGQITDSLSNQPNVNLFSRRSYEIERRAPFLAQNMEAYENRDRYLWVMQCIQGGLIAIMMGFSCYFLTNLYGKGLVNAGDFALILGLSMNMGHMMWFTMSEVDELNKVVGRCKQSLDSLMVPLGVQDKPGAGTLKCSQGHIAFEGVQFHYKEAEPIFENKSIQIQSGEKVGLVGYSGGGKSTFVHLILRLYDVTGGAILIDGENIADVTQESLRTNIGMIPQDPSLFHRSLMDNIRYGRIEASDKEVIEAAKRAHAHEFIARLPQGYHALVGERGVKLSGGQRQRIAIARAILKNAPILILDEATSQLDSLTENLIQASLHELITGKTTIVIAHRLSTLLQMDRILVFDKGKIIEDGPHGELLAKGGLYKKLWDAQIGGFLVDEEVLP